LVKLAENRGDLEHPSVRDGGESRWGGVAALDFLNAAPIQAGAAATTIGRPRPYGILIPPVAVPHGRATRIRHTLLSDSWIRSAGMVPDGHALGGKIMLDLIFDVLGAALLFGQAVYFGLFGDLPAGTMQASRSVIPVTADRSSGDSAVSN
jgi:hypothetical protein